MEYNEQGFNESQKKFREIEQMYEQQKRIIAEQMEAKNRYEEKFKKEKETESQIIKVLNVANEKSEEKSNSAGSKRKSLFDVFDDLSQTDFYKNRKPKKSNENISAYIKETLVKNDSK